jgi:hypothetical protein
MRLRSLTVSGTRLAAIAWLLATPDCLCLQVSGVDINDGGQVPLPDGGYDAGQDAGPAAGSDSGLDAGKDAGNDAGPDAGSDAGRDGGLDGGTDSGVPPVPDAGACDHPISDLSSSVNYPMGNVSWMASADFDGDGLLDLIAGGGFLGDGFSVFFGQADGTLSAPTSYDFFAPWFAVGDVNDDGYPDVVLSTNGAQQSWGLTIFLNDGRGGLTQLPVISTPYIALGIAIGDVNGDGRADLLANTTNNPNDRHAWYWEVFLQLSDGEFSPSGQLGIAPGSFAEATFGDLNGDGLQDLVTTTEDQSHVAVLLNQGDGGFETTLYQAPALGQIALLPRPGRLPDIVVGESGFTDPAGQTALGIGVMANAGDGTFGEPVTYATPGGNLFAMGDFNGDCLPDIATPPNLQYCQAGWPVSVFYGDAEGGFSGAVNLTYAGEGAYGIAALGPVDDPRAIAVGDFCGGGITVYGDASRH